MRWRGRRARRSWWKSPRDPRWSSTSCSAASAGPTSTSAPSAPPAPWPSRFRPPPLAGSLSTRQAASFLLSRSSLSRSSSSPSSSYPRLTLAPCPTVSSSEPWNMADQNRQTQSQSTPGYHPGLPEPPR